MNSREITLLPSVSSTADRASQVISGHGFVGGHFVVDVTSRASTDAGPVVSIQGVVPGTTGSYYTLLTSTAVGTSSTSTSVTKVITVAPWASTSANNRASEVLPNRFRVSVTYASTTDITYSVGATLA